LTYTQQQLEEFLQRYDDQLRKNLETYYNRNQAIARANDALIFVDKLTLIRQLLEMMKACGSDGADIQAD